jgi:hypothetical protein
VPWVKIDDQFPDHPKAAKAGPLAWALHIAGLCYCNRNLTDGFIPWSVARRLVSWDMLGAPDEDGRRVQWSIGISSGMMGEDVASEFVIEQLLYADMWEERDGGYYVHDFEHYQPLKAEVLAERAKNAERQARFRQRHAETYEVTNGESNAVTNAGSSGGSVAGVPGTGTESGEEARQEQEGKALSANGSETTGESLPVEKEMLIAKLLAFVGDDTEDREATAGTIRGLSRQLSQGSLVKVEESTHTARVETSRARYVVGALKSEIAERDQVKA